MTAQPLIRFPDPRLRLAAAQVERFGPEVATLAQDLADTLRHVGAIGLAAPHIGVLQRVIVARPEPGEPVRVYVNPVVASASDETETHEEGSVAMPGLRERILRPSRLRVAFQDVSGLPDEEEASGFAAAVLQHEIDQLDGIFFIDRLSRLKRDRAITRWEKARRATNRTGMI